MHTSLSQHLRGHWFALVITSYACGVIAVTAISVAVACAMMCAAAGIGCITRGAGRKFLGSAASAFAVGALCALAAQWRLEHRPYAALNGRHIVVTALALERPRFNEGASFRARIMAVQSPSNAAAASLLGVVALVEFPAADIASIAGHKVTVRGRFELPSGPRNSGEPAQSDALGDQGVGAIIAVHRPNDIAIATPGFGWEAWWARSRQIMADAIEERLPPLEATVLEGVLWGERGNLPADLRQEFADTGTVHVLTTAGLHLGILAGLVSWLLCALALPRAVRAGLTLAAAWSYAALAGMHLPTLRAATMLSAGVVALELGRGRTPSAIFAAAAAAVILPHPLTVLSPSFAMSFACVIGIAVVNPVLEAAGLRDNPNFPKLLVEVVRTSLAVQIALWPLQALYFNAFTPYAVLANAVVVPLIAVIMAAGACLCAASLIAPLLAGALANVVWWGLLFIIQTVHWFASLPDSHVDVAPPSHAFLIGYWALLAALYCGVHYGWPKRRLVWTTAAGACLLFIIYCLPGVQARLDPDIHLDAIDVGQADCLLVRAPGGHAMLVDGGGRLERSGSGWVVAIPIGDRVATRTVMPFLLRHWVFSLDAVVLTHPHGDHAGGLPVILSRERVDRVYDSGQLYMGPAYHRMLDVVRERHITWIRAQRGVRFDLGPKTHVVVLAPELPLITGTSSDINNNSVVLRVTFGQVAMLLTGDAQAEAEARLLSHGSADLGADILKVGHHGSAYSSTPQFLAAVHPKIAIISCGLHNVFGHPSSRTLAALHAAGAAVYRTDLEGGISVTSNGHQFNASP